MALASYPVWPFEPNWESRVGETLAWMTDVLMSPSGAEQRRSLKWFPDQTLNFTIAVDGEERSLLDNLLLVHANHDWYLPVWHNVLITSASSTLTFLPCAFVSGVEVGTPIFIKGQGVYDWQSAEVTAISASGMTISPPLARSVDAGTILHPMTVARLVEQPALSAITDGVEVAEMQFLVVEPKIDVVPPPRDAGPMIANGLIVNAYHQETGRGGYFHHNSGTSEGQFIFIYALFLAYEQLLNSEPQTANYYRNLAFEMLDAIDGPMLRQPIPDNAETLTLMHWLFAARGDIPGQEVVLSLEVPRTGNTLRIPESAKGNRVFKVWQIYPSTSKLLYDSPFSPAFDIVAPAGPTQIVVDDWEVDGDETVITIPSGAPLHPAWKVAYGFRTDQIIPQGAGFEAYPNWTKIPSGYSACAPDTFRWFEQSMQKAIIHDNRPGKAAQWQALQLAMRRTAVKGQNISDLREVFEPMPGFDAIPISGAPDGMFCFTTNLGAKGPSRGGNPSWKGYDYWSRDSFGRIVGQLPQADRVIVSQIGRGFSDTWRTATTYQDADSHLYIRAGFSRALQAGEHVRVFISATQSYDPASRWFADVVATPSNGVADIFIPRTAFRLATNTQTGEQTTWGSVLPAGQTIQNFGVEVANQTAITVRIEKLRLVADNTLTATAGSKMPFFPGALPFAINGDMRRQRFVGWNGSPFHGYQLPDHWWWLNADAIAVHAGKNQNDLPIPAADGSLTYPITAFTSGGAAKSIRAMLMEQQLLFLAQAQAKYASDGGPNGFFAHTFVLNTPARASLGNPTPHTWVYVNDDPNTRWVGYQTRVVESLAELVWLTRANSAFSDARALALSLATQWLVQLNVQWPNLAGKMVNGVRIYGMPTDFPDPAVSGPQTLYEEPHAAAHILRACVMLKKANVEGTALHDALILRCWQYLEMLWVTSGEMRYTWSPDPSAKQWYGFWHGDIIATLAIMLDNASILPSGVSTTTIRQRLVQTKEWIDQQGVGRIQPNIEAGLLDEYRGFHVFTLPPDWNDALERGHQRLYETFEPSIGTPVRVDTANRPFPTQRHKWVLDGADDHATFYALMQALRGRAVPVWVPTWMYDMNLSAPAALGATTIQVNRCGFTLSGGPRPEREDIMIETIDGSRIYRRITASSIDSAGRETLVLDSPLPVSITPSSVIRVCFMSLMRLDQDSIDIEHITDTEGVSEVSVTFRSAPNLRLPESAF